MDELKVCSQEKEDDAIGLVLGVAQAAGVVLLIFEVVGVGVVGDLEEVARGAV